MSISLRSPSAIEVWKLLDVSLVKSNSKIYHNSYIAEWQNLKMPKDGSTHNVSCHFVW